LPHEAGVAMFPEYRDLITRLKAENKTFARLFDEHNELDQRVKNIEAHIVPGTDSEVENLKKEKLREAPHRSPMKQELPCSPSTAI
ncbi:YdcH family protein, partial [Acinetobacter baumannii]|uniref:YdcH family protein n=1 Tax=Acinetobacter baumannii TaxID=470 RepID=UPI002ADF178C